MDRCLIIFDIDTQCLEKNYHNSSWQNAYPDIRREHTKHRLSNIQGTVYLCKRGVRLAHGTLALQEIAIKTMSILAGKLLLKALGLVMEWTTQHQDERLADWELARQNAELKKIAPLK